jgi:hypothetical protein
MTPSGAYYTLTGPTSGQRHYYLRVEDPSAGQLSLTRWSDEGDQMELDEPFDRAWISALSKSVGSTVVIAFEHMVAGGRHYPQVTSEAIH